ncbi:MAG: EVE domain-containing protein, partial [Chloroflexi bacterium]|nr:EVE domain-containing protein [Chloroflexota bacterium]
MGKNYWMMVASPEDFEITKEHGFTIYGVRGKYRRRAQRMQPEDRVLYYVKGLRKWTATATITSQFFEDHTPIWNVDGQGELYPFRVRTRPEIVLKEEDYIDALMLAPRLEYVKRWAPEDWPLAFFESLHLIPQKDFRL